MADKKPGLLNGRRKRKGEEAKHARRRARRAEAWPVTDDGAGPRDIAEPGRHHRK